MRKRRNKKTNSATIDKDGFWIPLEYNGTITHKTFNTDVFDCYEHSKSKREDKKKEKMKKKHQKLKGWRPEK